MAYSMVLKEKLKEINEKMKFDINIATMRLTENRSVYVELQNIKFAVNEAIEECAKEGE